MNLALLFRSSSSESGYSGCKSGRNITEDMNRLTLKSSSTSVTMGGGVAALCVAWIAAVTISSRLVSECTCEHVAISFGLKWEYVYDVGEKVCY